jgi:hypothetical protein
MLIHQIPSRVAKFEGTALPVFPAPVRFIATLGPAEVFGDADLSGRLFSHPPGAHVSMTANLERGGIRSAPGQRLTPPAVTADFFDTRIAVRGNTAVVTFECSSAGALETGVRVIADQLPAILSGALCEPVEITNLVGDVAGQSFRVEFEGTCYRVFRVPDADTKIRSELDRLRQLPADAAPRVFAAQRYAMQARWLRYYSEFPTQFAAERLLNLYKAIEVLFGRSVDELRTHLRSMRLRAAVVELVASLTYIRDEVDVGHPALATLTPDQHVVLQKYLLAMEDIVTWLIGHVIDELAAERFKLGQGKSRKRQRDRTIAATATWLEQINHLQPHTFLEESGSGSDGDAAEVQPVL